MQPAKRRERERMAAQLASKKRRGLMGRTADDVFQVALVLVLLGMAVSLLFVGSLLVYSVRDHRALLLYGLGGLVLVLGSLALLVYVGRLVRHWWAAAR